MAWVTPVDRSTGYIVLAVDYNQIQDNLLYLYSGRNFQFTQPADPTGNSSATPKMMGICSGTSLITATGVSLYICITGDIAMGSSTTADIGLRYGTGNGPANGASSTGTGNTQHTITASGQSAFSVQRITGLTPGTSYWFDLTLASDGSHTVSVKNLNVVAHEF